MSHAVRRGHRQSGAAFGGYRRIMHVDNVQPEATETLSQCGSGDNGHRASVGDHELDAGAG
ncbi:Uncharacterised protein [Mycobacteroides abscessus subsp. abscessus]|nr:Uncharacterised protein [Mycobacteroides abscessus subsp. abscessus]